jgi:uncharacterized repeat protein (TIGR01451 family)
VLPQGLFRVAGSNISEGGACNSQCDPGDVLRWAVEDLAPGQSELLWFRAQASTSSILLDGTVISFTANARTVDGLQLQDTATTVVQNTQPFELRVVSSANPVRPGEDLTYTIDFANRGSDPLDPVELTFHVPEGTAHASGESTLVWDLGRLSAGTGGRRQVALRVDSVRPLGSQLEAITEIVEVGSPDATSTATTQTPVATTPLLTSVEVNPDPILRGEYLLFTVTVSNPSPSAKTADVVVTLPAGMFRIAGSNISEGGACNSQCDPGDVLRWTVEDLAPGQSELLWFRAQASTSSVLLDGTLIPYDVEVRPVNEVTQWTADTVRVDAVRPLNLRVEESVNPASPGQELTYTIDFSNRSSDPLDPVQLTFRVPEGTTHTSGESTVVFDLGRLSAGTGGTREVTVTVDGVRPLGSQLLAVTEIVEVGSPHEASRATTRTPLSTTPLLATVTVTPDPAGRGAFLMFNVNISNPSPSTKTADVVVPLPQFMFRVSGATISGSGACDSQCDPGDVVRWTVENLAQGEFENLSFTAQVTTSSVLLDGTLIPYDVEVRPVNEVTQWTADTVRVLTP